MKHLFLDTNVIIDFLIDRKPFSISAAKLFDFSEKGALKIYIAAVSYNNIYYVVKKLTSHKETIKILKDLEKIAETIDTTKDVIRESINSEFKDFEDAIQHQTAITCNKIDAIITRNKIDFKYSKISVLTPDEALGLIESINS